MAERPLNVGLVGGGGKAFIVHPHQRGIFLDGTRTVVAGALSADPERALAAAAGWGFPLRGFGSYEEMIAANAAAPAEDKLDYVLIVTPNFAHFDPAMKALAAGIPVFCEKPLCLHLDEATELLQRARETGVPFALAHSYLGHWTSRFSRYLVQAGLLGVVRWVDSWYLQGWLASKLEESGQQQAAWRVDPSKAGASGCGGDIGTHALMQLRFVTGLEVEQVSAQLESFVEGRALDDHFTVYCRLEGGAKALVRASQICHGKKNDLGILVAGSLGTLQWSQENSEQVTVMLPGQPDRVYWRGQVVGGDGFLPDDVPEDLLAEPTIPSGHAEGFHDALGRLHRDFERDVRRWQQMGEFDRDPGDYAGVEDGWVGLAFLKACVESSRHEGAWVPVEELPARV